MFYSINNPHSDLKVGVKSKSTLFIFFIHIHGLFVNDLLALFILNEKISVFIIFHENVITSEMAFFLTYITKSSYGP